MYRESNLDSIKILTNVVETLKEEKDVVDGKLARLLKYSKDLEDIIESQRSDKVKEGVGYNVVPPLAADLYLSPKKDLSWTGLPEFVDDTVTDYSRPSPNVVSTSAKDQNKDTSTSEDVASPNPPKPFVKFVKPKDIKARHNFKEVSQHSGTPNRRRDLRRRIVSRNVRSVFRIPIARLGDKENGMSTYSNDSWHHSYVRIPKAVIEVLAGEEQNLLLREMTTKEGLPIGRKHYPKEKIVQEGIGSQIQKSRGQVLRKMICPNHGYIRKQVISHLGSAVKTKRQAMPTWCHMFNSTLTKNARVWFDDLPQESIDSYDDLKKAFLGNYLQQKKCIKDPVEIHSIKQREGESTKEFVQRYKLKCRDLKEAPECMKISGFMRGITNPKLIKCLHDKISKSIDEMIRVTIAFLRGEEDEMKGLMIIEFVIGGHFVYRMHVDGGSYLEIMYEHCFNIFRPKKPTDMTGVLHYIAEHRLILTNPEAVKFIYALRFVGNKMHKAFPLPVAKIPVLDRGKFEQWQFQIQQYLQHEHYALWEVIEFGNSYKVPTNTDLDNTTTRKDDEQSGRTVTITTEDMQRKKNDVKARTTLLLSLSDEHQNDLDIVSLDDLYNHLKVYEAEVQKESNSNSHNIAFISSSKNSSGNKNGNIACVSTSSTIFPTASASGATISQDTASAYIASQSNGEDHVLVADAEALTEFTLMANTESKVFNNSLCSNDCKKNNDSLNSKIKDLTGELSEANNYIYHYKLALAQLEGRLVKYKEREVKYIEKIRTLEMYRASNLKCIKTLDKELEELKLEKDGLDGKLAGLLKSLKNLHNLIESQRPDMVKEGVGYNDVPPLAADLYLSPKKDLSWTGLPEFVDDTITDYSRPSPTVASTSAEGQNKDSSISEDVASPNTPKPFVKFVKPKDNQSESSEFVLNKKACFNCSDFAYLANDYRKRVQRETTRSQIMYIRVLHTDLVVINHIAPMRPPLRSTGHRLHGSSMRPSHRPAGHRPHGPSMNPMRPKMNGARPNKSFFIQAHSYETRPFSSAVKTQYRAP
nr:reverse transcriptase domain-containing protein [Tanacetum cinerariifolium]